MTLFLFFLAKTSLVCVPTAHLVALSPLFLFWQAKFVQSFPLKPPPFCKLCTGLSNTKTSAISLSASRSLLNTLSYPQSFHLLQTLCHICQELSSLSSFTVILQWVPALSYLEGTTRLISWPCWVRYSYLLQSLLGSRFLPLVSTLLFSRTRNVLSHLNSLTHTFPRCPLKNLCSLVTIAQSSLHCNGHNLLLNSCFSKIDRIVNPSCTVCGHPTHNTFHLILHCLAADSLRHWNYAHSLSLYHLWSRPWRVARLLELHGLPPCPHILKRVGQQHQCFIVLT